MQLQLELVIRLDLMKDKTGEEHTERETEVHHCTHKEGLGREREVHTRTHTQQSVRQSVWEAIMDE